MKKVICIIVAVVVAAGAVTAGCVYWFSTRKKAPDIRDTPIPQTIDISSSLTNTNVADTPIDTSGATEDSNETTAMLFGVRYPAQMFRSAQTYLNADGIETAVQRKTFYKDENGSVLYTSLIEKEEIAVYDASGAAVYYSGSYKPEADYLTEPVHWFYRDGKLACAELCFYDGDNNGVAYYNADGTLLCIRTEIFSADKKDGVQMDTVFYGNDFTPITEDAFRALLPQIDADAFLYINWG